MLILQRRVGQRLVIAGGVEVTVTAIARNGVRLAIVAPRGVGVLRGEVFDAIAGANLDASESPVDSNQTSHAVHTEKNHAHST